MYVCVCMCVYLCVCVRTDVWVCVCAYVCVEGGVCLRLLSLIWRFKMRNLFCKPTLQYLYRWLTSRWGVQSSPCVSEWEDSSKWVCLCYDLQYIVWALEYQRGVIFYKVLWYKNSSIEFGVEYLNFSAIEFWRYIFENNHHIFEF